MEQSVGTIQEERTRIQLHSNEVTVCIVSLRRELDETRASALTVAQNQTIDTLRCQVESSNNSAKQAHALLRANQEQHSRMPPLITYPSGSGGLIGNTPFIPPCQLPRQDFAPESSMVLDITI